MRNVQCVTHLTLAMSISFTEENVPVVLKDLPVGEEMEVFDVHRALHIAHLLGSAASPKAESLNIIHELMPEHPDTKLPYIVYKLMDGAADFMKIDVKLLRVERAVVIVEGQEQQKQGDEIVGGVDEHECPLVKPLVALQNMVALPMDKHEAFVIAVNSIL